MTNRSEGEKLLNDAVDAAITTSYPTNYTELKASIQDRYGVTWKSEIIRVIAEQRRQDSPGYKDGSARRQVDRYEAFLRGEHTKEVRDPSKPRGAMKTALVNAGKEYPKRDAPPGGLTITIKGMQKEGKRERPRTFTLTMTQSVAQDFVQAPNLKDFFRMLYPKMKKPEDVFFGEESSALYDVSISAS